MDRNKEKISNCVSQEELIDLCKGLATYRSFSGEEKEVALFLGGQLEQMGLEVYYQEVEKDRFNVIGKIPGVDSASGKSMMFNGHLDVDPITLSHGADPWNIRVEGNKLHGHGLRNMKAGVACMTMAAKAIKKSGIKLKGDLYVAGVVGELQGGIGTKALVDEKFVPLTDYAVVPEPSYMKIRTVVAGVMDILIHVKGISSWIGTMHVRKHVNTIEKVCRVIEGLKQIEFTYDPRPDLPDLPKSLIGTIIGGLTSEYTLWRPSFVPDYCTISYEVRTLPGQTFEAVLRDIRRVLAKLRAEDPDLDVEIETSPSIYRKPWNAAKHWMPSAEVDPESRIVQAVAGNHKEILQSEPHIGPEFPGSYGGNDSGHLIQAGIQALTYGPSEQGRPPEHFVEIDKLIAHAKVLALTAYDLCS